MDNNGGENGGAAAEGEQGAGGGAADLLGGVTRPAGETQQQQGSGDQGGASGQGGAQGGADPDWYGNLSAEADGESASNRDWIKAKGFKDLDSMTRSLRAAEKAIHDSGRVKIPGEGAAADEVAAFRKALGVPDEPTGYEFKAPLGEDGEPIKLDDAMLTRLAESAHKNGVPKGAAEALVSDYIQGELDQLAAANRELDEKAQAWIREQGAAANAKIAAVDRAANMLGISREEMQALRAAWGPDRALSLLSRLGEGMGEDMLVAGDRAKFGVSGAEAQTQLDQLKQDPAWVSKATKPGTPENARYNRLLEAIGAAADRAAAA